MITANRSLNYLIMLAKNACVTCESRLSTFEKAACGLLQNDRVCVVAKILLPSAVTLCVCAHECVRVCVCFGRIIT